MNNVLPKSDEENLINEEKITEVNATIIYDKRDNITSSVVSSGSSDTLESEKHVKNASSNHFRHIDHTKIQSDTKDIIDDSGDNIIHLKRVTTTTPTIPTIRTTLPNTFSNAGGNGGHVDNVQMLTSDSVIRKRHRRRRQGRYFYRQTIFLPYFTKNVFANTLTGSQPKNQNRNQTTTRNVSRN